MRFSKKYPAAVVALALVAAPAVAQAVEAKSKPVSSKVKRAGSASKEESKLGGGSGTIVAIVAAAAVIVGIVVVSGDDSACSP